MLKAPWSDALVTSSMAGQLASGKKDACVSEEAWGQAAPLRMTTIPVAIDRRKG
jgi:hypothetical protein